MLASPLDPALAVLKREARAEPQKAVREAAREFEQLFVQMLMKAMREATAQHDPLASDSARMFQGMLDAEWAKGIARRGIGLAPILERQLARNAKVSAAPESLRSGERAGDPAKEFLEKMLGPAQAAARATGLPPAFILGQAALESGWGRHEIRRPDGTPTFNLFGIKAGAGWRGAVVEAPTVEYVGGEPRRTVERFRAYRSYEEAFADYARLLTASGRYAVALGERADAARFAQAIQRAGYATDPDYAGKLARTIRRVAIALA
jgi:flagellar protein FlgJ